MTIQADDFESNSLTGTLSVSNQAIIFNVKTSPLLLEGDKTFTVTFRKGFSQRTILETGTITLKDTSTLETFTPNVFTLYEGDAIQYDFITSNVNGNLTLYYSTEGNVTTDDFVGGNTGSFILSNNYGSIVLVANSDLSFYPDEQEQYILQVRRSPFGEIIANSDPVVIVDTSNIVGLISVQPNSLQTMYETEAEVITLNTRNAVGNNAATLYYTISGNADIYGNSSGDIIINNNIANLEIIADASVPDNEERQFFVEIRRGSITGPILGTTANIIVKPLLSDGSTNVFTTAISATGGNEIIEIDI